MGKLIKCKTCKGDVAKSAKKCPHCGEKMNQGISPIWVLIIGGIVIASVYNSNDNYVNQTTIKKEIIHIGEKYGEHTTTNIKQIAWIDKCKKLVLNKLKDSNSAKFQNVFFIKSTSTKLPTVCGEVNSKNSFGGYGGFKTFISSGKQDLTFIAGEVKDFQKLYDKLCN